ncbi:MAG: ABC transporter ATP-binding protein [Candidatus Aegiribacteria sp. MLS_C]|nr:MAG: ABC transporter ATP-binding protein [Candidatus Aegiribacteria sp. MLS_C]
MDRSILEIDDLTLELGGRRILDCLSLDLWEGHVHAVVGPNGAGKSTLANTVMGLSGYREYTGTVKFLGNDLYGLSVDQRARLGIGMAWQEPARFRGLGVEDFILSGSEDKSAEKAADCLMKVDLDPEKYLDRAVDGTLSGGERKRIELASILAQAPRLVMMDEPDSGIDVEALKRIFDAISVLRGMGSTVLLITHSMTVLEQADHAFLLCCGSIQDKGGVEKITEFYAGRCIPCDHKNRPEEGC